LSVIYKLEHVSNPKHVCLLVAMLQPLVHFYGSLTETTYNSPLQKNIYLEKIHSADEMIGVLCTG